MRYVWTDSDSDGILDPGERTQITEYAWDHRNRLVSVTERATEGAAATQVVSYTYDAFNRLVGRTVTMGETVQKTVFVYDGIETALQFDGSGTNDLAASDLTHRYLWSDAVDQLLTDEQVHYDDQLQDYVTDETLWALTDNLNTIRDLVTYDSGTTAVVNHRVIDSYGNVTGETNPSVDCIFAFTGRFRDPATGLQYNHNRWYDASVGRWLSEDPLGFAAGDANLYRYVGGNPVSRRDPMGLDWLDNTGNFFAGFGDTVSFGLTGRLRRMLGIDCVNRNSGFYGAGEVAGAADNLALGFLNPCQAPSAWSGNGLRIINGLQGLGNAANAAEHASEGCYGQAALDALGAAANAGNALAPCFVAGTPLLTPEGAKAIEQIRVGDLVLSAPEDDPSAPVAARRVEEVFERSSVLFDLHVGGQSIRTTPEHPFYVQGKGWKPAKSLLAGDLLRSHDGQWLPVESTCESDEVAAVYNLRVEDYHTYFVGSAEWAFSVWVHNACRTGDLPGSGKPNSSAAKEPIGSDAGQIRDYGPDGRAMTDYDFGHPHDPNLHAHDWDWTMNRPRQPRRDLLPGE